MDRLEGGGVLAVAWKGGGDGDMLVEDECKSWLLMNNDVALCRRRPSVGRCRH